MILPPTKKKMNTALSSGIAQPNYMVKLKKNYYWNKGNLSKSYRHLTNRHYELKLAIILFVWIKNCCSMVFKKYSQD